MYETFLEPSTMILFIFVINNETVVRNRMHPNFRPFRKTMEVSTISAFSHSLDPWMKTSCTTFVVSSGPTQLAKRSRRSRRAEESKTHAGPKSTLEIPWKTSREHPTTSTHIFHRH